MTTKTENARRVAEHRQRVKDRNALIDDMVADISQTAGLKFAIAPVTPFPEHDPLKNGIKVTYYMTEEMRDRIRNHAAKEPTLTFDTLLSCLDIRLMKLLLDEGFVRHDFELVEEEAE